MSSPKSDSKLAKDIVLRLTEKGVKVLALDFDKTIVSVHTAGFWKQGTRKLAEHVRPCFRELVQAALESPLHVCIVTYSMQPLLIYDVLKYVLPKSDINKVVMRASSPEWSPTSDCMGLCLGKEQHLAWIVTTLFNKKHVIIHPEEIMLMDDDEENITTAKEFGHQAMLVTDTVSLEQIARFCQTVVLPSRDWGDGTHKGLTMETKSQKKKKKRALSMPLTTSS